MNPLSVALPILVGASGSAYVLSWITGRSFINIDPKKRGHQIWSVGKSAIVMLATYCALYYTFIRRFTTTAVTSQKLGYNPIRMVQHAVLIELGFYIFHRLCHTPWFYKYHAKHHLNQAHYPFDYVDLDPTEEAVGLVFIHLPLYFVPLSIQEYMVIQYIYTLGGYIVHSDLLFTHHQIHHRHFKTNFCYLFPLFDWTFGTYQHSSMSMARNSDQDIDA
jgi:sterol desaturase/sphingolipid hydroxylase (fatty acid hydroxylase superfamily)